MIQQRKKRNSSKVNLIISAVFHTGLILGIAYLAAREGYLGKTMKQLAVTMVKEKKPEPPKEKPPEPKPEPNRPQEAPKTAAVPPPVAPPPTAAAPPPDDLTPSVAPAAAIVAGFEFNDGAKQVVEMSSDPRSAYKGMVEHLLRTHWNRPEDIEDAKFVVEVELTVDNKGRITNTQWMRGSGNTRWDDSVKEVLAETKAIGKAPPKGFPETFTVRFDVESMRSEPLQLSSR